MHNPIDYDSKTLLVYDKKINLEAKTRQIPACKSSKESLTLPSSMGLSLMWTTGPG